MCSSAVTQVLVQQSSLSPRFSTAPACVPAVSLGAGVICYWNCELALHSLGPKTEVVEYINNVIR